MSPDQSSLPSHHVKEEETDDDMAIAFASIDFTGVTFDDNPEEIFDKECTQAKKMEDNSIMRLDYNSALTSQEEKVEPASRSIPPVCQSTTLLPTSASSSSSSSLHNSQTPATAPIIIDHYDKKALNRNSMKLDLLESPLFAYKNILKIQVEQKQHQRGLLLSSNDERALFIEKHILLSDCSMHFDLISADEIQHEDDNEFLIVQTMSRQLSQGYYIPILEGIVAQRFFQGIEIPSSSSSSSALQNSYLLGNFIRQRIFTYCHTVTQCIQLELLAVASFQLFLQFNYTGPTFFDSGVDFQTGKLNAKLQQWLLQGEKDDNKKNITMQSRLEDIYPHSIFKYTLFHSIFITKNNHKGKVEERNHDDDDDDDDDVENNNTKHTNENNVTLQRQQQQQYHHPSPQDNHHTSSLLYNANPTFQNIILSELAVDGEWPCPICRVPYFLLLARIILQTLADPHRPSWLLLYNNNDNNYNNNTSPYIAPSSTFVTLCQFLIGSQLWNARTIVAHTRLLQGDEAPSMLWEEVQDMFQPMIQKYCFPNKDNNLSSLDELQLLSLPTVLYQTLPTKLLLEYGLAQHHFHNNHKKGKDLFHQALKMSGLEVTITGSQGRRTKYQQKSTAQYLVRAKPRTKTTTITPSSDTHIIKKEEETTTNDSYTDYIKKQLVDHPDPEENPLLDKVAYVEEADNIHHVLSILHQAILLALCLDVKNENPMDGLTAEEMGAYLERVLQQHDDWMVFATGLLERAWLEYERNHTKMRAILQLQALVDQHTHRLTITQSTVEAAIENSAPPQERLKNLHYIVYPPRWEMLRDLAERYAQSGIVTSAAELFEEIELWDEVVECYRQAGKEGKAEQIVRSRLKESETPRMWTALGDITKDPSHYHRAIDLSRGRFAGAYAALGKYHFDKGELKEASQYYESALRIKPHSPPMWFRLGTIAMRLQEWPLALQAFTEVVQQEPEEGDAWANVAAIHMHNRRPDEAYPALVESLKINRDNWRVWVSKLYTCIDLKKYDEAIQACMTVLDLRAKSDQVPQLEEKCIRAIVKGSILRFCEAERSSTDKVSEATSAASTESAQRTLKRVTDLVSALLSTAKSSDTWIYEVSAFLHKNIGLRSSIMEDLMKEYRALQSHVGWETDDAIFEKICRVLDDLASLHLGDCNNEEMKIPTASKSVSDDLKRFRYLLQGILRKVRSAYFDPSKAPLKQIERLEHYIEQIDHRLQ